MHPVAKHIKWNQPNGSTIIITAISEGYWNTDGFKDKNGWQGRFKNSNYFNKLNPGWMDKLVCFWYWESFLQDTNYSIDFLAFSLVTFVSYGLKFVHLHKISKFSKELKAFGKLTLVTEERTDKVEVALSVLLNARFWDVKWLEWCKTLRLTFLLHATLKQCS